MSSLSLSLIGCKKEQTPGQNATTNQALLRRSPVEETTKQTKSKNKMELFKYSTIIVFSCFEGSVLLWDYNLKMCGSLGKIVIFGRYANAIIFHIHQPLPYSFLARTKNFHSSPPLPVGEGHQFLVWLFSQICEGARG